MMDKKLNLKTGGFTLIELLIVVAIIAILAAIAVPNFLEAQVRAKISRAHADMRSLATAIESYAVDHTKYPPGYKYWNRINVGPSNTRNWRSLSLLTTPVAFINSVPHDAFNLPWRNNAAQYGSNPVPYHYEDMQQHPDTPGSNNYGGSNSLIAAQNGFVWALSSTGPGRFANWNGPVDALAGFPSGGVDQTADSKYVYFAYDATNGTVSKGIIGHSNQGVLDGVYLRP